MARVANDDSPSVSRGAMLVVGEVRQRDVALIGQRANGLLAAVRQSNEGVQAGCDACDLEMGRDFGHGGDERSSALSVFLPEPPKVPIEEAALQQLRHRELIQGGRRRPDCHGGRDDLAYEVLG